MYLPLFSQVLVPKDENLLGKMVEVDVVETGKHYLKGELVTQGEIKRPDNVPPPLKKGEVSGIEMEVMSTVLSSLSAVVNRCIGGMPSYILY